MSGSRVETHPWQPVNLPPLSQDAARLLSGARVRLSDEEPWHGVSLDLHAAVSPDPANKGSDNVKLPSRSVSSSDTPSRLRVHMPTSYSVLTSHKLWASICKSATPSALKDLNIDITLYLEGEDDIRQARLLLQETPWPHGTSTVREMQDFPDVLTLATPNVHPRLGVLDWVWIFKQPALISPHFVEVFGEFQFKFFCGVSSKQLAATAGFSLSTDTFYEDTLGYRPSYPYSRHTSSHVVFSLQQPQANGGLYPLTVVATFGRWLTTRGKELLPQPGDLYNGHQTEFFMAFGGGMHRFLIEHGMSVLYPGANTVKFVALPSKPLADVTPSELQVLKHKLTAVNAVNYLSLPVYDGGGVYQKNHAIDGLWPEDTSATGICTLILTIYSRHTSFVTRLRYYNSVPCLKEILVIWNNVNVRPPALDPHDFHIPVTVDVRSRNSLNNRFLPNDRITTDCVIIMDDDWNMPRHVLNFAARVWRESFQDAVIGLQKQGRMHAIAADGTYTYKKNMSQPSVLACQAFPIAYPSPQPHVSAANVYIAYSCLLPA